MSGASRLVRIVNIPHLPASATQFMPTIENIKPPITHLIKNLNKHQRSKDEKGEKAIK